MLLKNKKDFIKFYQTLIIDQMADRIECINGLSFSCQYNFGTYSKPIGSNKLTTIGDILGNIKGFIDRKNGNGYRLQQKDYEEATHFEIGFPSEKIDLIIEYAENKEKPTDTVYLYVPVETIIEVINNNGGINLK